MNPLKITVSHNGLSVYEYNPSRYLIAQYTINFPTKIEIAFHPRTRTQLKTIDYGVTAVWVIRPKPVQPIQPIIDEISI